MLRKDYFVEELPKVLYGLKNNFLPFFAGLRINLETSTDCLFGRGLLFSKNIPSLVSNLNRMRIGRSLFLIPYKV